MVGLIRTLLFWAAAVLLRGGWCMGDCRMSYPVWVPYTNTLYTYSALCEYALSRGRQHTCRS